MWYLRFWVMIALLLVIKPIIRNNYSDCSFVYRAEYYVHRCSVETLNWILVAVHVLHSDAVLCRTLNLSTYQWACQPWVSSSIEIAFELIDFRGHQFWSLRTSRTSSTWRLDQQRWTSKIFLAFWINSLSSKLNWACVVDLKKDSAENLVEFGCNW